MCFSGISSVEQSLSNLKTADNVEIVRTYEDIKQYQSQYKIDRLVDDLVQMIISRLEIMSNIFDANEADREELCRAIVTMFILYINLQAKQNFKIGSKHNLGKGFTDFTVFKLDNQIEDNIIIFEIKKAASKLDKAGGQLILELDYDLKRNNKMSDIRYGFVSNFEYWKMYKYQKIKNRIYITEYPLIHLYDKKQVLNREKIYEIVYSLLYAMQNQLSYAGSSAETQTSRLTSIFSYLKRRYL